MTPLLTIREARAFRGRWIELRYDGRFEIPPERPLLQMKRRDGRVIEAVLPAPIFGRGRWLGLCPPDLETLTIYAKSPDAIRIESLKPLSRCRLALRLLRRDRIALLGEVMPFAIRTTRGRASNARTALLLTKLGALGRQIDDRSRKVDVAFDRIPSGAKLSVVLLVESNEEAKARATLASLEDQSDPSWGVALIGSTGLRDRLGLDMAADRVRVFPRLQDVADAQADAGEWLMRLEPGDRLPPYAVAAIRGAISTSPGLRVLTLDSASTTSDGQIAEPVFRPAWSPTRFERQDYVGASFVAAPELAAAILASDAPPSLSRVTAGLDPTAIRHLPRLCLLQRRPTHEVVPRPSIRPEPGPGRRRIAIVMPTRDRVDLLRVAVESVLTRTSYPEWQLVVADNESRESETLDLLAGLCGRARAVRVPGDFNFSRIVNRAVATTDAEIVVLLNNDVEIRDPDWLSNLIVHLDDPGVGAVGAKLLYPNGTLQHAGVVIGWGGYAGHFGRRQPADWPGHLGRLLAPHEVSAVTAACLAVRREHYDRVGGFDEDLAVAFNDVDFCLKLQSLGLRNIWTPETVLIHHESASRGQDRGAKRERFRLERSRFADRWRSVIQNDPYFHPGWSLTKNVEMLE